MREIRFRAWDKKSKVMRGEVLSICWIDSFHCSRQIHVRSFYPQPNVYPLDDIELMQFIGLKDINGCEIYEGDIVKWTSTFEGSNDFEHIDTVEWVEDMAVFMLRPWCHEIHAAKMEVIGNIYKTPELLK